METAANHSAVRMRGSDFILLHNKLKKQFLNRDEPHNLGTYGRLLAQKFTRQFILKLAIQYSI